MGLQMLRFPSHASERLMTISTQRNTDFPQLMERWISRIVMCARSVVLLGEGKQALLQ